MTTQRTVTFITHDLSRTGAPRVLLSLMRWLRAYTDLRMSTLAVMPGPTRPGPLLRDFAALGPIVELEGDWRHALFLQRGVRLARQLTAGVDRPFDRFVHRASGFSLWLARSRQLKGLGECDLIYANSVQSGWGVRSLPSSAPLLSHLHELEDALLDPYEAPNVRTMCGPRARHLIVPAVAVRDLLVQRLGVDASRISVRYPFIDVPEAPAEASSRAEVRRRLEIPEHAIVVGMCGQFILRKGPDRFVDIAARVLRQASGAPVYFVWIGGSAELEYGRYMTADIRRLGLEARFRHVTEQVDPRPYLGALDVFLLSSRSDPFPLVCLEAAAHAEAPIICFDQAGGMPELVGRECGVVVPYLDTAAAAEAVLSLANDPTLRRRLGANAAERVRQDHNVTRSAPAIGAIITAVMDGTPAVPPISTPGATAGGRILPVKPLDPLEKGREAHSSAPLVHAE